MAPTAGPSRSTRRNDPPTTSAATPPPPPAGERSTSVATESPSKDRAGLRLLEGPVQITLDGFTRSFHAIKSHAFVGKPLADTLLDARGDDQDEDERELMQGAQEMIQSTKLRYFAPYPHLVALPPLSSTDPSVLVPYQKLNLASALLILQLVSVPPPPPPPPLAPPKRKRGPAKPPPPVLLDDAVLAERADRMRELRGAIWGGVMSLVAPRTQAEKDYLWDGSGFMAKPKPFGKGPAGALAAGKEAKERRKKGWEERLEVMLEICTAVIVLTNPTSDEPVNAVTDARIVEILKGDFLEADELISRADFKGPSGAVFRNVTEKRAVANVMWKKLCIARVLNLNGLTAEQMSAKYPVETMAQLVGAYLMGRVWLPFLHNQKPSDKPSFNNPSTPGQRLTDDDFESPARGGPASVPKGNKPDRIKKVTAPSARADAGEAEVEAADEDEDEEEMVEAVDEDSEDSPDDADPEADAAPQPSAIARGKQKAALSDDDGLIDVGGDASDPDQGAPARDDAADDSAEDEIEVEGITAEDVIGYVGRDPYDTTVPRKQQSTLRRSLSKDTRVTWSGKVSAQGPPLPAAAISYLESELQKGRTAEDILAQLQQHIREASQPVASGSRPTAASGSGSTTEDEADAPSAARVPRTAEEKLAAAKKKIISGGRVDDLDDGEIDELDESDDGGGPPAKKLVSNAFVTDSGFRYSTGGNRTGRLSWTPDEDKCLLKAMEDVHPGPTIWSKVIALHGPNGVESHNLKDRNIQSCKDRARNIKVQMLRKGKVVPEFMKSIKIPQKEQDVIDRLAAAVAPTPRPGNAAASGSGTRATERDE